MNLLNIMTVEDISGFLYENLNYASEDSWESGYNYIRSIVYPIKKELGAKIENATETTFLEVYLHNGRYAGDNTNRIRKIRKLSTYKEYDVDMADIFHSHNNNDCPDLEEFRLDTEDSEDDKVITENVIMFEQGNSIQVDLCYNSNQSWVNVVYIEVPQDSKLIDFKPNDVFKEKALYLRDIEKYLVDFSHIESNINEGILELEKRYVAEYNESNMGTEYPEQLYEDKEEQEEYESEFAKEFGDIY